MAVKHVWIFSLAFCLCGCINRKSGTARAARTSTANPFAAAGGILSGFDARHPGALWREGDRVLYGL